MIRFDAAARSYRIHVNYDTDLEEVGRFYNVLGSARFPDDLESVALSLGFDVAPGPRGPVYTHRGYGARLSFVDDGPYYGPGRPRSARDVVNEIYDEYLVPETGKDLRPKQKTAA